MVRARVNGFSQAQICEDEGVAVLFSAGMAWTMVLRESGEDAETVLFIFWREDGG